MMSNVGLMHHLVCWWVGGHNSLAISGLLLGLMQHLPQLVIPARHKPHVGVNLEVELLTIPELLGQMTCFARPCGFLPWYAHLPDLQQEYSSFLIQQLHLFWQWVLFPAANLEDN